MADESDVGEHCDDRRTDDGDTAAFSRDVLSRDRIFEVLADERRRYLCYLLCDRSELHLDDAVAAITDWESEDQQEPEAVLTALEAVGTALSPAGVEREDDESACGRPRIGDWAATDEACIDLSVVAPALGGGGPASTVPRRASRAPRRRAPRRRGGHQSASSRGRRTGAR